jgi:hypothetical protein
LPQQLLKSALLKKVSSTDSNNRVCVTKIFQKQFDISHSHAMLIVGKARDLPKQTRDQKMEIDIDEVMEAAQRNDGTGFCLECGNEQYGCEPDARDIVCEACRMPTVCGAEEILLSHS